MCRIPPILVDFILRYASVNLMSWFLLFFHLYMALNSTFTREWEIESYFLEGDYMIILWLSTPKSVYILLYSYIFISTQGLAHTLTVMLRCSYAASTMTYIVHICTRRAKTLWVHASPPPPSVGTYTKVRPNDGLPHRSMNYKYIYI